MVLSLFNDNDEVSERPSPPRGRRIAIESEAQSSYLKGKVLFLMEAGKLRIGSIVIDCDHFEEMMNFWKETLHYVPRRPPDNGWVILRDPEGRGPNVSINRSGEGPLEQYRLHLDLYTDDQEGEVKRLLGLGAILKRSPKKGEDFVTLADPDGNLFDVIDTKGR
jgi:hypothetical protein